MPPAGSYAVKHIYVGPAAADSMNFDLVVNLFLTLCGFVPGIAHALYLFARYNGWGVALVMNSSLVWLLLLAEGIAVRLLMHGVRTDRAREAAAQAEQRLQLHQQQQ
ncbi:plasma membrane proteolipid Pmp3 [Pleodorina starrii]|nr:plasma membrane proteolipid Pmp3 [Pleodorina starrii]